MVSYKNKVGNIMFFKVRAKDVAIIKIQDDK